MRQCLRIPCLTKKEKGKENSLRLIGVAYYAKNANGFFKDSCKCFFVDKAVSLRGDNVFKLFASAPVGNRLSSVIEGFCRKGIRVSADDKGEVEEIAHPFLLQIGIRLHPAEGADAVDEDVVDAGYVFAGKASAPE